LRAKLVVGFAVGANAFNGYDWRANCAEGVWRAISMELVTMVGDIPQTGVEAAPVVRDPERFETFLTVFVTAVVIVMVSVLAVAMNLT
jgi:hypothetical protein